MKVTRRRFLGTSAAAAVSAAGCKALERGYPERYSVEKPPVPGARGWVRGEERLVRSACLQCEGGCGIQVRVVEGRAVRIEGNPDYPTNQGGLCPKGLNGLQVLYDPDRIRGPLAREGARGAGRWRRISWDEAIARVARPLAELRQRGASHTVAVLGGRYRGHMRALVRRFLAAYGSPNEIDHESIGAHGDVVAHELAQGVRSHLAYDWERTRYVLAFGAGLVESFRPTAMMLRVFGRLRGGRSGERAKIAVVDPRFGVTSARADEWVPIRPGTDGALALGIAHVLVRDRLWDERFVREHVDGFDAWTDGAGGRHEGFADLVRERYAPERVAGLTDVPAATIERLARELAGNRPAIVVSGRGATGHTNGVWNALAIHALNALLGSIDVPGGVLVQREPPLAAWPDPEQDDVARRGAAQPRVDLAEGAPPFAASHLASLAERIETGRPYPLGAVLLYYTNPLFSAPEPERLRSALGKVPLVVSFSPFLDESTAMADLVLPDHTYLERWQLDVVTPSVGYPVLAMRQPVVEPLHDTRSTGQVLVELARALGGSVARSFPKDELELVKDLLRGVHASGRGSVRAASFEEFWRQLLAAGGWWDPPYAFGRWSEVLRTPSGRYELSPARLRERIGPLDPAARARLGVTAQGDEATLPHHEPVALPPAEAALPFHLVSYKTMTHAEGRGANQPNLQEMYAVQFDRRWEPWIELDARDARSLGVKTDDEVWLELPAGRMKLKAVVEEGGRPGVVAVPFEYGHGGYGRWAAGRGDNVNRLSCTRCDPLGGSIAWYDARAAVRKA